MLGMKRFPDKFFQLSICDPQYGINRGEDYGNEGNYWKQYTKKDWDKKRPEKEYFTELFRVSENQIIWGGNYFTEFLPASMGWIFWDKGQRISMSDGELAFSSFSRALRVFTLNRCHIPDSSGYLHPTQKPVKLYKWLLKNYAKEGDKILDSHMGSQSSRIAAYLMGFDYWGYEIDSEYFEAGNKRFKEQTAQLSLL